MRELPPPLFCLSQDTNMAWKTFSTSSAGVGFMTLTYNPAVSGPFFPTDGKGGFTTTVGDSCVGPTQNAEVLGIVWNAAASGDSVNFEDDAGAPGPSFKHSSNSLGLFINAPMVCSGPFGVTLSPVLGSTPSITIFFRQG